MSRFCDLVLTWRLAWMIVRARSNRVSHHIGDEMELANQLGMLFAQVASMQGLCRCELSFTIDDEPWTVSCAKDDDNTRENAA